MTPASEARCVEHPTALATPCSRCGTFRCEACLSSGVCNTCRAHTGVRHPVAGDGVEFGRRAGGRILDLVLDQVVALGAGLTAGIVLAVSQMLGFVRDGWAERLDHGFGFNLVAGIVASVVGSTVGATVCGASFGKAVLGMRVVNVQGDRAGLGANFIRELAYFVDALFFGLVGKARWTAHPFGSATGTAGPTRWWCAPRA
jgi:uncharacterized RDD family membrane protein YckC